MTILCDCSTDGGSCPEFIRESTPVARKEHICCECGYIIEEGQMYHRVEGVWEGDFSTHKTCWACHSIRMDYCSNGYIFGELAEQIYNCLEFDYRKSNFILKTKKEIRENGF